MKQTNNAIKFLMAQYRAIFKNANLKMILAAAAAAGALSAGAANAASADGNLTADEWAQAFKDGKGTVTITGKDTDKGAAGKFQNIKITDVNATQELTLSKDQKLVIADETSVYTENDISASGSAGKLSITGEGTLDVTARTKDSTTKGLAITAKEQANVTVNVGTVNAMSDLYISTSGTNENTKVVFTAKNINIGAAETIPGVSGDKEVRGRATLTVGNKAGSGSIAFGDAGSTININKAGKLRVVGISGAGTTGGTHINAAQVNVNGGIISFGDKDTNATALYKAAKTTINNGWFSVKKDAGLTVTADTIDLNGTSIMDLASDVAVEAGTINVGSSAILAASKAEGNLSLGIDDAQDDTAVLKLSSASLKQYLTAKDAKGEALKYLDEDGQFTKKGDERYSTAVAGSITLKQGGTIELTDSANIDVADTNIFKFANDKQTDGKIYVSGAGTLKGQNLTVSKALTGATKLEVAAKNLTLGSKDFDGQTALGVGNFWAENVTFVKNKDGEDYSLKNSLYLENAGAGSITGHVDIDGGEIVIESGKYTANGNVILTASGSGTESALYVKNAASALKVNGLFETTATKGTAIIEDGVLDLRNASELQVAQGTIDLQDVAELYVDGSKFITKPGDEVKFDETKFAANAVTGNAMSTMHITGLGSLTMAQYKDLVTKTGFSGSFTGFDVTGTNTSGSMTFSDSILSGTPDSVYGNTVMTVGADAIKKTYSFGAVKLAQSATKLTIGDTADGVVKLTNANLSSKGLFVETNDGKAGDVHLATKDSGLKLVGTGKVGNITAAAIPNPPNTARESGLLLIGDAHKYGSANVTVTGNIGETNAILDGMMVAPGSRLTVDGTNIDLRHLYVTQGASLNAPNATITLARKNNVTTEDYAEFEVLGSLTAKNLNLAFKADTDSAHVVAGGATLKLSGKLSLVDGVELAIGSDDTNGLGAVVIADTLDLPSGAGIFVDPPYGKKASALIINNLKNDTLNGELGVGQNAVAAIGFADEASAMAVVADYLDANGSFNPGSSVKNALVDN